MSRMIILAGAPEPAKLDWSEKSLIPSSKIESISTFSPNNSNSSPDQPFKAQWRQLSTENLQMRPSRPRLALQPLTQINPDPAEFFSPADHVAPESPAAASDVSADESQPSGVGSAESTNEALADYYDNSFATYEAIPSSQLAESTYTPGTPTYESSSLELSITSTNDSSSGRSIIRTPSQRRLSQAPRPSLITNLCDIPNAQNLQRIHPQTKTVNLIVGILKISPTRKVTTGKAYGRPRQVELVDLIVGDETKPDFAVTMWLPRELHVNWRDRATHTGGADSHSPSHSPADCARSELRRKLKGLRLRDVIILQNVALNTYQGKVAGASLKGEVTKLELLYRRKVEEDDEEGCYSNSNLRNPVDPQLRKVKGVRDWLVEFVGEDPGADGNGKGKGKKKGRQGGGMYLPDDSQLP